MMDWKERNMPMPHIHLPAFVALMSLFTLFAPCFAKAAPAKSKVVVIHGDKSVSSESERRYAKSLALGTARMMKDAGLAADVASDASIANALASRSVAILVDCTEPPAAHIAALRDFIGKGGRLIVEYSPSGPLAGIIGVSQGRYIKGASGAFETMDFVQDRPLNIPPSVGQSSSSILTALPVKGRSRAIAWWSGRNGKRTEHPAILMSDKGFWITHVISPDGNSAAKGRLLVALAAHLDQSLWKTAAAARLESARHAGPWESPSDAAAKTRTKASSPRWAEMRKRIEDARKIEANAKSKASEGRHAVAWMLAGELDRAMKEAYGLAQKPAEGEIRAVWDHAGTGLGDWPSTCRALKAAGVTDILVKVGGPGFSYCDAPSLPRSTVVEGDQLKACIAAAKPLGLRVHAWLICFSTTEATPSRLDRFRKDGWLLDATTGASSAWIDPANPSARARIVRAAEEMLCRYKVDGIHLDFVRYPDYYGSLGTGTRIRFETDRGKTVAKWPDDAKRQPVFGELVRWRTAQVTALVADIRAMQRRRAPGRLVTAAVLGKYPTCVESVGQDWMAWLECGYVDYVFPMNYTEDISKFNELLATQLKKKGVAHRVVGGIGVTAAESRLASDQVIDQIAALRRGGAAGFALFDLDSFLVREVLPILGLGMVR